MNAGTKRKMARLAGLAGVLAPILAFGRLALTGEIDRPVWDDPVEEIVSFYEGSDFNTGFMVGILMVTLAYVLYVVFLAKVSSVIRAHETGSVWLARSILGLGVLLAGLTMGYLVPLVTSVFWASHGGLSTDAYLALHGLSFASYWLGLPVDLLLGTAFGASIVMTGLFPRWLGWAMILTAAAETLAFFASVDVWNAASGLPYVWMLIAGTLIVRSPDRYVQTATI
jgi:hypothetical protein